MEIVPFTSVGNLKFGESRKVSRKKLASKFETFRKDRGESETDAFDALGLHLYYDERDDLEFVEAFEPANITFRGICFLDRDLSVIYSEMESIGFRPTESDVGVKFPQAGIALTADSGIVEGVAAHRKGYYERP